MGKFSPDHQPEFPDGRTGGVIRLDCPHCRHRAKVRTSLAKSSLKKELRYACENVECGHTFVAELEIVRTISRSACPDPTIKLPGRIR